MRALWATPLGVPGKVLRQRWPGGYQARRRRPGNAVPSKNTHPLNIIDITGAAGDTLAHCRAPARGDQGLSLVGEWHCDGYLAGWLGALGVACQLGVPRREASRVEISDE